MELVAEVRGRKIGLDTAPIIYFVQEHPDYLGMLEPVFRGISQGEIGAVTSTITLLEILVLPLKRGNEELAARYQDILLHSQGLDMVILTHDISRRAAEVRAKYGIRTPDAIQIATSVMEEAEVFITNDKRLRAIEELTILILDDFLPELKE